MYIFVHQCIKSNLILLLSGNGCTGGSTVPAQEMGSQQNMHGKYPHRTKYSPPGTMQGLFSPSP
jgi:hypothetical protein